MTRTRMDDVDALERLSGGASYDMMTRLFSQYRGTIQLSRTTIQFLYRKYGILKKLVNIPANQMTFRWGYLQLGGKDGDAEIREAFERHTRSLPVKSVYAHRRGLATAFNLAQKAANKGGNGAILLDLEDGGALDEPINYNKLKRINGLFVLNRWAIKPLRIGATTDHDFYRLGGIAANRMLPSLVGVRALQSVHRSRVLWFRGEELDDDELMQTGGCDDSVFESILSSFFDYQDSICGAKQMIKDFDIFVHKLEGLLGELAEDGDGEYEALMQKRLESNDTMRRVHRTQLIDKDKEDLEHSTRQVSGYSDLMTRILDNFLANTELTPAELLGKYPEGMADTGKTEQQNANDRTSRFQAEKFQSNIMDFCEILFRCKEGPTKGKVPDVYDFVFSLLYPVTPPEQAELQLNYAQIDDINIRNQVYSGDDVAKSRYGGNEFQPNMIIDFNQREKDKKAAEQQSQEEQPPPEDDIESLLSQYQTDSTDIPRLLPPPEVQAAARQGVTLYRQNNIKTDLHLTPLATRISMGQPLQPHEIQAMRTFFISPKYRKVAKQPPSEGFGAVVWLMMGGDVGDLWSGAIAREMERRSDGMRMDKPCGKGFIADKLRCHSLSPDQQYVRSNDPSWSDFQRLVYQAVSGKGKKTPFSQEKRDVVFDDLGIEGWDEAKNMSGVRLYHKFGFSPEEFHDLNVFTGGYINGDFNEVAWAKNNAALRGESDSSLTDRDTSYVLGLTNALKKLPAFNGRFYSGKPMTHQYIDKSGELVQATEPLKQLHRRISVDSEFVNSLKQKAKSNDLYVEQSFGSTTTDPNGVGTVTEGSNLEMRIKWKKDGSQGRWIGGENEVLFLPGTQFKVASVEDRPPHPQQARSSYFNRLLYKERQWDDYQKTLGTGFLSNLVNKVRGLPTNRDEFYRKNYKKKPPLLSKVEEAQRFSMELFNYNYFYEWGSVKHIAYLEEV